LYEGFGIPPLEAMACGGVAVAARAGSLPEILGDAAIYFEATSDDDLLRALRTAASDSKDLEGLRDAGKRHAAAFTWDTTVRKTIAVYKRVLGEAAS
jgi:glycosyltransferase involved in cell wall biosynthesis